MYTYSRYTRATPTGRGKAAASNVTLCPQRLRGLLGTRTIGCPTQDDHLDLHTAPAGALCLHSSSSSMLLYVHED